MSVFNPDYTLNYSDMDILPNTIAGEQKTPLAVVESMVDSLDNWTDGKLFINPNYRFLDIYSKSGIYLAVIYNKLMKGLSWFIKEPENRSKFILDKMLYGLSPTIDAALVSRKTLYSNFLTVGNIIQLHGLKTSKGTELSDRVKGALKNMKFDVVIGNPPYNNDVYLDFVTLGDQLSTKYTCMITPAKWQAKGGDKNDAFRKNIVPRMSHIVFYPVASDVFDIAEPGGISYFAIHKEIENCRVKTVSNCPAINSDYEQFNSGETLYKSEINDIVSKCNGHRIISRLTLKGNGSSFLRSLYLHESFKPIYKSAESSYNITCYSGSNIVGYVSINDLYTDKFLGKWKITQTVMLSAGVWAKIPNYGINPLNKIAPNCVPIGSYPVIAVFDTEEEADSFISYCNCKLIKFLHYLGINATTETSDFWRFIPSPNAFDHIFTDDELYKKYNLTPNEIAIIESVIKERK